MPQQIHFMHALSVTARCAMRYREEQLKSEGLTGIQCNYLLCVVKTPGVSQDALCKQLYVNKSSVARQLATLEQGGYITKTADESDRRAVKVYPTKKAHDVLPKIKAVLKSWRELVFDDLNEDEAAQLSRLLERVMHNATQAVDAKQEGE